MRKSQVLLVLIVLLFISSYCENKSSLHNTITFINESNDTLYVDWAFNYPDTLAFRYNPNPTQPPATRSLCVHREELGEVSRLRRMR